MRKKREKKSEKVERKRERGRQRRRPMDDNAAPTCSKTPKKSNRAFPQTHLGLDVLDGCCSVDGPEGDIDGDAEAELALDDGHPRLDDEGPAAHELGLAHRLEKLLQAPEKVLALVPGMMLRW